MQIKGFCEKYENKILAGGLLLLLMVLIACCYDYFYSLNDDVLIKDIISGVYSGAPESRDNQMLYPLSLLFSLLYKLLPMVPWFGIFLCGCQYGCLYLIAERSLVLCKKRKYKKIIVLIIIVLMIGGCFLEHLVLVQYTVSSGLLATTAIFLMVTEQDREHLLKRSIPYIGLAILALLLRSEMLLLMLPFICIAGLYVWSCERKIWEVAHFKKYFGIIGCLMACVAGMLLADTVAYGGEDWKEFRRFFDARTTLYDYTGVPLYEQNTEFYEQENISKQQYELLQNYNYGLEQQIDADFMENAAAYAKKQQPSLIDRLKTGIIRYRYRITNMDGFPYCLWAVAGYLLLALSVNRSNKWRMLFLGGMMLGIRSVVWIYILMTNRIPDRITHPLYFAECLLLVGVFLVEVVHKEVKKKQYRIIPAMVVLIVVSMMNLIEGVDITEKQIAKIQENNVANTYFREYCEEHQEDFFFLDVYSSIYFTEKIFVRQQTGKNYELLGGWICNSPIYDKKLEACDILSVEDALLKRDNVYLVQKEEKSLEWLEDYYAIKGQKIKSKVVHKLKGGLEIYSLEKE